MMNLIFWSIGRCIRERRAARRRLRGDCRPWPGRMALVVVLVMGMTAASAEGDGALYQITASPYANIRADASKDSADIGDAREGTVVRGTYADGWVLATSELLEDGSEITLAVEPGQGYIRADLLTLAGDDYPLGAHSNATGGRVRVRQAPGGDTRWWLQAGETVDVLRWIRVDGEDWAETEWGYIRGDCLTWEGGG